MSTGDRYCSSCFGNRQNQASKTYDENYGDKYWGLYLIPIIGQITLIGKYNKYPGGTRYHVYINSRHERWSRHERSQDDLQYCRQCRGFASIYYELESWE